MTRQRQLLWLLFLSGFTATAQYTVQGVLASAHNPLDFPQWFWVLEFIFWGARALLESWLVAYLFVTATPKLGQKLVITVWEGVVLVLIFFTVGGALRALGYAMLNDYQSVMLESLKEPFYTYWSYAIGGYTATMMAAAGTAYRTQPTDNGHSLVDASQLQKYENELRRLEGDATQARGEAARAQLELDKAHEEVASVARQAEEAQRQVAYALQDIAWMQQLEETTQARLLFLASGGNGLTPAYVAKVLGIAPSTSSRAKATMDQAVDAILAKREAEKGAKG